MGAGLGQIEQENAVESRLGVGGEWILFRLYLLDCHRPSWHLLPMFIFLEFLSFCLTSEQLGAAWQRAVVRRGSGAGLGSAGSSSSRCPEGSGLSSGVKGTGPAVLGPGTEWAAAEGELEA